MNARDMRRLERRRRGEPTLPLESELTGLTDDEQAEKIAAAAAIEAAWWRGEQPPPAVSAARRDARRSLLASRVRSEVLPDVPTLPRGPQCPWCARLCATNEPACSEHAELERCFLQAAGDGWG